MPVLTAYAPQPFHSEGWAPSSMHPNVPFLSSTSRFGSVVSAGSPLVRSRQKRCKSQFEKMKKSMAVSLQPSKKNKLKKRSAVIENSTQVQVTSAVPVIKGILLKPSTLLNLYQSNLPVTGSEIKLVAGSTSVRSPSVSIAYKSVFKKVRFSISRPQNSVLQTQSSTFHPRTVTSSALNESDLPYHESHLEPVTETIFFTHSRYSYDRSPIAVDKVLNKSLALPPRTPIDAFSAGRWLPKSRPTNHDEAGGVSFNRPISCIPSESTDELNLMTFPVVPRGIATSKKSTTHSSPLAIIQMEVSECCDPGSVCHTCGCEDGSNELGRSLTDPRYYTVFNCTDGSSGKNKSLDLNCTESLTSARNLETREGEWKHHRISKSTNNASIIEDNLTFHSFSNLKIEETSDESETYTLELDDIFGIGKWTRAQVFGSCDALDGF